jgi:F-type H+-transporting ATPase subunit gamma
MGSNLRAIRRKIKTVRNIWQITRAMQMVAAARLKRVQPRVEASRAYMARLAEIARSVASHAPDQEHPYLLSRPVRKHGLVVIAGDKGLAGAHNVNVLRAAEEVMAHMKAPCGVIAVGVKAADYGRRQGWEILDRLPTPSTTEDQGAVGLARSIRRLYDDGMVDDLSVVYTEFLTPMRRVPRLAQLLPLVPEETTNENGLEYLFEPPAPELLAALLPRALDAQLINMMYQSLASEHAARMTAMAVATENAEELRVTLTRDLNRARQSLITTEILEVVSGSEAMAQQS